MPKPPPLPDQFTTDPRVHVDKTTGKFQYEDDETGQTFEWTGQAWIPLLDETLIQQQQAAYSVQGVDENVPAAPVLAREERLKKRKEGEREARAPKQNAGGSAPKKTAVWVSNLPPDTTPELLASVFSKAGVLLIGDDGKPRIKMYYDDEGKFKGDALIMYFKEGSVDLAITLLDDSELVLGAGYGNMRVRVAEYDKSSKAEEKKEPAEKKKLSHEEKQRVSKRMRTLQNKLAWHSDSDSDDDRRESAAAARFNRVVVLKGMFVPEDLEKEPELLLELKEDVREEAETLGAVTSVVLYDKEPDGVMTIKFKDPTAAQACIMKMNGRYFDKRRISAQLYTGKERYRKSGQEADDEGEQERLDKFADWLADTNE